MQLEDPKEKIFKRARLKSFPNVCPNCPIGDESTIKIAWYAIWKIVYQILTLRPLAETDQTQQTLFFQFFILHFQFTYVLFMFLDFVTNTRYVLTGTLQNQRTRGLELLLSVK